MCIKTLKHITDKKIAREASANKQTQLKVKTYIITYFNVFKYLGGRFDTDTYHGGPVNRTVP